MRVALLAPGPRDETYGANPAYPAMLARKAVPRLLRRFPSDHRPVLAGQSLGALAALHAAWSEPAAFAGLLLQSGSFFTPVLDGQESGFSRFGEVTDFVATVHAAGRAPAGFPAVAMTCGTAEENLGNNHAMRGGPPAARGRRDLGRGPAGPHLDVLARPPRPAPHDVAQEGVVLTG